MINRWGLKFRELIILSSRLWKNALSITIIVFWVIGLPLMGFVLLWRKRKNLNSDHVKRNYLLLYQGLKPSVYYWEFVNLLRKILIVLVSVMFGESEKFY